MKALRRKLPRRDKLNQMLSNAGLATLDNPRDLFNQLASAIDTHEEFKAILFKVEPEQRANCYKSLAPRLRFAAKPLDVYEAEAKHDAERQRLPHLDERGNLIVGAPARTARPAAPNRKQPMTWNPKHMRLTLTCAKCTKQEEFFGDSPVDAATKARKALWIHEDTKEICPKCPAIRPAS